MTIIHRWIMLSVLIQRLFVHWLDIFRIHVGRIGKTPLLQAFYNDMMFTKECIVTLKCTLSSFCFCLGILGRQYPDNIQFQTKNIGVKNIREWGSLSNRKVSFINGMFPIMSSRNLIVSPTIIVILASY